MHLSIYIYNTIGYHLHYSTSRGFQTDREQCYVGADTMIEDMGFEVSKSEVGAHEVTAESRINSLRDIANTCRRQRRSEGIRIPQHMRGFPLHKYAAQVYNSNTTVNNRLLTPKEEFAGKKPDATYEFKYAFGNIVEVKRPGNDKKKFRTQKGMVWYRDESSKGSHMVYIFEEFKALPRRPIRITTDYSGIDDRYLYKPKNKRKGVPGETDSIGERDQSDIEEEDIIEEITEITNLEPSDDTVPAVAHRKPRRNGESRRQTNSLAQIFPTAQSTDKVAMSEKTTPPVQEDTNELEEAFMSLVKAMIDNPDDALIEEAALKEIQQLVDHKMFSPIDSKKMTKKDYQRVMRGQFTMVKKVDANGKFAKWKGRQLANPTTLSICEKNRRKQLYESYSSPTTKREALMIHLHMVATRRRKLIGYDITGAYLHCMLMIGEHYYLILTPEIANIMIKIDRKYEIGLRADGSMMVQLDGTLYGLHESSGQFYDKVDKDLTNNGYKKTEEDPCTYMSTEGSKVSMHQEVDMMGNLWVDDILASFANDEAEQKFDEFLSANYKLGYNKHDIDEEDGISYVGLLLKRNKISGDITISQPGYTQKLLDKYKIEGVSEYPCNENIYRDMKKDSPYLKGTEVDEFHSQVQEVAFLTHSRLDICPAVGYLKSVVNQPTEEDKMKLLKVMKYLNGTKEYGRVMRHDSDDIFRIMSDGGHNCHKNFRGQNGIVYKMGNNVIHIKCSKQKLQSRSTAETELITMDIAVEEGLWLKDLTISMGATINKNRSTPLFQDNKSSILIANRGYSRNKHIAKRFAKIQEQVEAKKIHLVYERSDDLVADFFTKGLTGKKFKKFRYKLLNMGKKY